MIGAARLRDALLPALARTLESPTSGDPNRILILQPDHLGDIILSEPAVRLLRESLPDARLTAVVGPWSSLIARLAWPVDELIEIDFPGFNRALKDANPAAPYLQLEDDAERLRAFGADRAVVLRDDAWWATALARASVSGAVVAAADPRNRPFATTLPDLDGLKHRTKRAMTLAAALMQGSPRIEWDSSWDMSPRLGADAGQVAAARAVLAEHSIGGPFIVLHPGAGAPVKTWSVRYWRAVVASLDEHRVVLTGSEAEEDDCRQIAAGFPHAVDLAGKTTLDTLIGLLHLSQLAVGTDNGPMHIGAALGTPTVRLYGPSNPARYGPPPGDARHRVLTAGWRCPRCEDLSTDRESGCGCMASITPDAVLAAIDRALSNDA